MDTHAGNFGYPYNVDLDNPVEDALGNKIERPSLLVLYLCNVIKMVTDICASRSLKKILWVSLGRWIIVLLALLILDVYPPIFIYRFLRVDRKIAADPWLIGSFFLTKPWQKYQKFLFLEASLKTRRSSVLCVERRSHWIWGTVHDNMIRVEYTWWARGLNLGPRGEMLTWEMLDHHATCRSCRERLKGLMFLWLKKKHQSSSTDWWVESVLQRKEDWYLV